jgi:hypothetical protein
MAPSTEALWDSLLSRGRLLFAMGTDDSHYFTNPWDRAAPRPGQAWVMVRADTLTPGAIVRALSRGEFYATNGVTLSDLRVTGGRLTIEVGRSRPTDDTRYHIEFIGRGGRVLAAVHGMTARYDLRGDEGYVRVRVTDSHGWHAWTQPVWLKG